MHFHFIGEPVHDVLHNLAILMYLSVDWMPSVGHACGRARELFR